jgi:hypothetical protein
MCIWYCRCWYFLAYNWSNFRCMSLTQNYRHPNLGRREYEVEGVERFPTSAKWGHALCCSEDSRNFFFVLLESRAFIACTWPREFLAGGIFILSRAAKSPALTKKYFICVYELELRGNSRVTKFLCDGETMTWCDPVPWIPKEVSMMNHFSIISWTIAKFKISVERQNLVPISKKFGPQVSTLGNSSSTPHTDD